MGDKQKVIKDVYLIGLPSVLNKQDDNTRTDTIKIINKYEKRKSKQRYYKMFH